MVYYQIVNLRAVVNRSQGRGYLRYHRAATLLNQKRCSGTKQRSNIEGILPAWKGVRKRDLGLHSIYSQE